MIIDRVLIKSFVTAVLIPILHIRTMSELKKIKLDVEFAIYLVVHVRYCSIRIR